jgi:16S rRNA (uracil1498-N3)-methyltransferase
MNLFYAPSISGNSWHLDPEESKHCTRVLRLKKGDTIHLADGRGNLFAAIIASDDPKRCRVEVVSVKKEYEKRDFHLHIAIAPTKNTGRFEWFLEKATEIGIDEITPVFCHHSERIRLNNARLEKVLVAAMKQSLKAYLPLLHEPVDLAKILAMPFPGQKFIAWCGEGTVSHLKNTYRKGSEALVLIGPEGDFSPEEIDEAKKNGFVPISLGKSRLRTETAGIVACHTINLVNE